MSERRLLTSRLHRNRTSSTAAEGAFALYRKVERKKACMRVDYLPDKLGHVA